MAREDEELDRDEPKDKPDEGKREKEEPKPRADDDVYELEPAPKSDDDDDESEDEKRKTRAERRRERGELYRRFTEQNQELQTLKERLARAEGVLSRPAPQPEKTEKDPLEAQIEDIERQGRMIVDTYNARRAKNDLTAEQHEQLRAQARELENKKARLIVQQEIRAAQPKPPPPEQIAAQRQYLMVQARHPDVVNHPDAWDYARNLYLARSKLPGFRGTMESVDEIMEDAREKFGFKKAAKPTQHMRDAYASTPRGSSGPSDAPKTYKPTDADRAMADRRYPYIKDERARMQKFVQEVIRPSLDKQKRTG
jgi:hypothetical protein